LRRVAPGRIVRAGPDLYLTVHGERLLARGAEAQHACRMVGGDPRWSDRGRGWVVGSRFLPDLLAWAQSGHLLAIVSDVSDRDASTSSGVAS
jgi:hypothetical protein